MKPPPDRVAIWLEMLRKVVMAIPQPLAWVENAEHIPPPLHQRLEQAA